MVGKILKKKVTQWVKSLKLENRKNKKEKKKERGYQMGESLQNKRLMKNYLHKYQLLSAQHKPFKPCIVVTKVYGYWFVIMDSFVNPVESNCWNWSHLKFVESYL